MNKNSVKCVFIGDSGVGKTSILLKHMSNTFQAHQQTTLGASFFEERYYDNDNNRYSFQYWDTAGQERYRSLCPMYLRNADIVIMIYDLFFTRSQTSLRKWYKEVIRSNNLYCKYIIIGNKNDIVDMNTFIHHDNLGYLLDYLKCPHLFVSAKTGNNIKRLFDLIHEIGVEVVEKKLEESIPEENIQITNTYKTNRLRECCNF